MSYSIQLMKKAASRILRVLVPTAVALSPLGAHAKVDPPASATNVTAALPLTFERNQGQEAAGLDFVAHGQSMALGLSPHGVLFAQSSDAQGNVDLGFIGASPKVHAGVGVSRQAGVVNYFIGNDPTRWHRNVPTYSRVRYQGVYPGVDVVYYGNREHLEYDLVVAPGANARVIGLSVTGADSVQLDAQGALNIARGGRSLILDHPIAYQLINGHRQRVASAYRLDGNQVHFEVGQYNHSRPLIIDPVLSYFSYLGGSSTDVIGNGSPQGGYYPSGYLGSQAIGLDAAGDVYVAGYTTSTNFPTQSPIGAAPTKTNGTSWAFVSKFAADGKSLIFSTYLGGTNGYDFGYALAVDSAGNAFVGGQAGSSDFPVTSGAYQTVCSPNYNNQAGTAQTGCGNDQGYESFLAKLSPTGALTAATFLGGTHTLSTALAVTVDSSGRPYLAGYAYPGINAPRTGGGAQTVGFPTTSGAVVAAYPYNASVAQNGNLQYDAYVSVFNASLTTLVYSTLIGDDRPQNGAGFYAQGDTVGTAVALDKSGNIYLTGETADYYLPTTSGAYIANGANCGATTTSGGDTGLAGHCGFVAKFGAISGSAQPTLTYATYLGGSPATSGNYDILPSGIAADSSGNAYIVGFAEQAGFPTTSGAYQTTCNGYGVNGGTDSNCFAVFIAKLNPAGTTLLAGTYFGCATCNGDPISGAGAVVLDAQNNVWVTGYGGNSLPVVNGNASDNTNAGEAPFIATFNSTLTTLSFMTFVSVGNAGQLNVDGLALDGSGGVYIAGSVNTPANSAATTGAFQTSYGGGNSDGFVAKLIVTEATSTTLSISPATATVGTAVTMTATVAEASGSGMPTGSVTFKSGSTTLGSGTLNSKGMASFTSSSLTAGSYSVIAVYGGDSENSASTSGAAALTVAAAAAPTVTVAVNPTSVTVGTGATLTWSSTNATSCTATGGWTGAQATSGSVTVTPTASGTATYTLTCAGAGGSATSGATLTVNAIAAPTVTLAVSPTSITLGSSATLTWSSANATTCTASGAWTGTQATGGTMTETPTATGTQSYVLACTGTGGTTRATATLSVAAAGKHGGGALNLWMIVGLAGLVGGRMLRHPGARTV